VAAVAGHLKLPKLPGVFILPGLVRWWWAKSNKRNANGLSALSMLDAYIDRLVSIVCAQVSVYMDASVG
jgi:hypothetical protein